VHFSYWETEYFLNEIDYLIVGAGLTGLQTAINLKEKNSTANVVVIDRFAWSLGASTRNAGFACFANVSEIIDDLNHDSPKNVYALAAKRYRGLKALRSKFGDDNIGYEEKGSVEIFTNKNKAELHQCIDSIQAINNILYQETGLEDVFMYSSKAQLPNTIGSIHNKFEGQLNTGNLYKTIFNYAESKGVRILGGLEVISWTRDALLTIQTKQNIELKAHQLILCTNAFTSHLIEEDVIPARGQVIMTQKVEKLPCVGLHHFDNGYYYWRDIDQRILLGGARNLDAETETTFDFNQNESIIQELKRFMNEQIFGEEVAIEFEWSGIMGMGKGKQKTPIIKEVEPQVFVAARLGGMGVALSALIAEEIANLVQ
jgi:gamma-glutamylputrescine oxidase